MTRGRTVPTVEGQYRASEVREIVGITYRQLDWWVRTEVVRPSLEPSRGRWRAYSFEDLVLLTICDQLREAGVELETTRKVVTYLRDTPDCPAVILSNGEPHSSRFFRWPQPTPVTISIPVASIRGDVERRTRAAA